MAFLLNEYNDDLLNDLVDEMLYHIYHMDAVVHLYVFVHELKDYKILKIVLHNSDKCILFVFFYKNTNLNF